MYLSIKHFLISTIFAGEVTCTPLYYNCSGGCPSTPPLQRGESSSCTGVGSTVQYQCNPRLVLLGHGVVTCSEEGDWNPDPTELTCKGESAGIVYNYMIRILPLELTPLSPSL